MVISVRSVLLYVHRDRMDYQGREAQDGHLTFTQLLNSVISGSVQCCFTSATETVGLLGTGSPGQPQGSRRDQEI